MVVILLTMLAYRSRRGDAADKASVICNERPPIHIGGYEETPLAPDDAQFTLAS
jgi:hypothetical protein